MIAQQIAAGVLVGGGLAALIFLGVVLVRSRQLERLERMKVHDGTREAPLSLLDGPPAPDDFTAFQRRMLADVAAHLGIPPSLISRGPPWPMITDEHSARASIIRHAEAMARVRDHIGPRLYARFVGACADAGVAVGHLHCPHGDIISRCHICNAEGAQAPPPPPTIKGANAGDIDHGTSDGRQRDVDPHPPGG